MRGVKDGTKDGINDGVPEIPETDTKMAGSSSHMTVPYELEGTFIVPLAHNNLGGCVPEVAGEIEKISRSKVSLENTEYIVESPSSVFASEGIHHCVMGTAHWVLLEHQSRSLDRGLKAFYSFYSVISCIISCVSI